MMKDTNMFDLSGRVALVLPVQPEHMGNTLVQVHR